MSQYRLRPRRYGASKRAFSLPYGGSRKAGRLKRNTTSGHAITGSVGKNEYHGDHKDQYVLSLGALTLNPYSLADIHYQDSNGQNQAKLASSVWYHVAAALLRRVLRMVVKRDIQYPLEKLMYDLPPATANNLATTAAGGLTTGDTLNAQNQIVNNMEHYGSHGLTSINACRLRLYWAEPDGRVHTTVGMRYNDVPFMFETVPSGNTGITLGTKKNFGQVAIDLAELLFDHMEDELIASKYRYPYAVELFGVDSTAALTNPSTNNFVERALCAPIIIKDWVFKINTSGFMRIQNQTLSDDGSAAADVVNGNPLVCVRQVFTGMPRVKPLYGSNPQAPIQTWTSTGDAPLRNPEIFQTDSNGDCILKHLNSLRKLPPRHIWTNCIGEERFVLAPGQVYTMPLRCSFSGKLNTLLYRLRDYNKPPDERLHIAHPLGHSHIVFASHYMAADYPAAADVASADATTVPVLIAMQYHAEFNCGASCRPRYRKHIMVLDAAGIYQPAPAVKPAIVPTGTVYYPSTAVTGMPVVPGTTVNGEFAANTEGQDMAVDIRES